MDAADIILGITFLNRHRTVLETNPGYSPKFIIDDCEIPILKDRNFKGLSVYTVKALDNQIVEWTRNTGTVVIPPQTTGVLKLKVPCNEKLLRSHTMFHPMEPNDELTRGEVDDLKFQEGLIKVRKTGNGKLYAYVGYINHTSEKMTIKDGEIVGGLSISGDSFDLEPTDRHAGKYVNSVRVGSEQERWAQIEKELVGKVKAGSLEEKVLHRVIKRYKDVIQLKGEPFRTTGTVKHHIDNEGPPELFIPQYKVPLKDLEDIEDEMARLEDE